jgi:hypothetical protein
VPVVLAAAAIAAIIVISAVVVATALSNEPANAAATITATIATAAITVVIVVVLVVSPLVPLGGFPLGLLFLDDTDVAVTIEVGELFDLSGGFRALVGIGVVAAEGHHLVIASVTG